MSKDLFAQRSVTGAVDAEEQDSCRKAPHYYGHRERLRGRLFERGADSLQDYELLELLLFAAIPRRDVKPLAKTLLETFGDLWSLLNAGPDKLLAAGLSEAAAANLLATGAVALRAHKGAALRGTVLNSWQRVVDYCRAALAHEPKEQFRILFIDRKNHLLAEDKHQRGTIDHTPVYPREIVQRALEVGAGALVLVHNHPSGDPQPSREDIEMTNALVKICMPLGITIHDHLVIGREGVASFKVLGLL
ncbi:MAG: DNA repair protein RadC [Bdellovibrionales bacterium]